MTPPKPLTFDEWNRGAQQQIVKSDEMTLHVAVGHLEAQRSIWTADVQRLETFRRQCLVQKPPYKQPGWRPKK